MSETWSSALLDCGARKTVCGQEWLNEYINNLSEKEQQSIIFTSFNTALEMEEKSKPYNQ